MQSIAINVSVRLCVCLSASSHILKTTHPNFTKLSVHVTCLYTLPVAVARSSSDDNDVTFALNRPDKRDANRAYCQSSSPEPAAARAKSDVWDCLVIGEY